MRRPGSAALVLWLSVAPVQAQSLSAKLRQAFTFGDCGDLICLNLAVDTAHGRHFIPDAANAYAPFVSFLTLSAAQAVANVPLASTSSGAIFQITAAGPVKTAVSAGPIFAERYQTMGRGSVFLGLTVTVLDFSRFRGHRLDGTGSADEALTFTLTHDNIEDPRLGDPAFERDVIRVSPALELRSIVSSLVFTYGLSDKVDVGLAVPVVHTSLDAGGFAEVIQNNPDAAPLHFFSGTIEDPNLTANSEAVSGNATGFGDIAARVKLNLAESRTYGFSFLADARIPSGKEEDFLGSGEFAMRGVGIVSAQYGHFSPHLNAGFLYRRGDRQNSAILATAGFDHLLADWGTLAVDLISETLVGNNELEFPRPVTYNTPPGADLDRTSFPFAEKDHVLDASFGFKVTTSANLALSGNILVPLLDRGLQPTVAWSFGVQKRF